MPTAILIFVSTALVTGHVTHAGVPFVGTRRARRRQKNVEHASVRFAQTAKISSIVISATKTFAMNMTDLSIATLVVLDTVVSVASRRMSHANCAESLVSWAAIAKRKCQQAKSNVLASLIVSV